MPAQGANMEIDTREFQRAMHLYAEATKKDESEILNKAAYNVLYSRYGVIRNAKKAKRGEIDAKLLGADRLLLKLASRNLGKGSQASLGSKHRTKSGKTRAGSKWQRRVKAEARRIIGRRRSAIAYYRAGWVTAGYRSGLGKSAGLKKFQGKRIGSGIQATEKRLLAVIGNHVDYADEIGKGDLRRAMRGAAKDMGDYARKKMEKTAKKYSGRKR